jgi:hypothetical protein
MNEIQDTLSVFFLKKEPGWNTYHFIEQLASNAASTDCPSGLRCRICSKLTTPPTSRCSAPLLVNPSVLFTRTNGLGLNPSVLFICTNGYYCQRWFECTKLMVEYVSLFWPFLSFTFFL